MMMLGVMMAFGALAQAPEPIELGENELKTLKVSAFGFINTNNTTTAEF